MRRVVALIALAVVTAASARAVPVDAERVRLHAEAIRSMYPRLEASAGEREAIDYVLQTLRAAGAEPAVLDFSDFDLGHSYSSVVDVTLPGRREGAGTVIVATPLNHRDGSPPDADGSASLAAALSLAEAAVAHDRPVTMRFLFLGAEHGARGPYPLGTRRFLRDYFPDEPQALIYLEANSLDLVLETGGEGVVAPAWLVRSALPSARSVPTPIRVQAHLNQLHRLGVSDAPRPLGEFLRAGIPAVLLTSDPPPFAPPALAETALGLAAMIGSWTEELSAAVSDEWDRHYLYFRFGATQMIIGEPTYLLILLGAVFATLAYAVVFRRQLGRYVRTIVRNSWNLPVLFLLVFLFLSAGTYLLRLFLVVRRFPTLWEYYPGPYVAFKIVLSLFLFTGAAQLLRRLPLSKNGSFYSAAALFVLFVDVILFSIINISFGYFFVWAFACAFLFSVLRSRPLKGVLLAMAPLLLLRVAFQALAVPELRLAEELLLSTRGDLILSFVTLPFLLMLIRLDFLIRHPVRGRRSLALRSTTVIGGALVAGLAVYILVSSPYTSSLPQPVEATEVIDYRALERTLTITSPAPLGRLTVAFAGRQHEVNTLGRSWSTASERLPDVMSVRLSLADFLDRERAVLTVDAAQPIEELSVRFHSSEPMVLYDVNYPHRTSSDRRETTVFIGRRPPLPLQIEFTMARGTVPAVEIVASSTSHPEPLEIRGDRVEVASRLVVVTGFGQ